MIDTVYVSQQARDQMIKLKRYTGVAQWNVLCRWGLVLSLAEPTLPADTKIKADQLGIEWKTFAGPHGALYWALVRQRCSEDGLPTDEETVAHQFRLHLHRGLGYLAKQTKSVTDLAGKIAAVGTE